MFGVCFVKEFDSEVVNCQGEGGWLGLTTPEAGDRGIAEGGKMVFELVECQNGCFLETVHAFSDFHVHIIFGVKMCGCQIVFVEHFLG